MREIKANEYLQKSGVQYAVIGTLKYRDRHILGSFGNESLAQDFINGLIEHCDAGVGHFELVRIAPERTTAEITQIVPESTTTPEPYTHEDIMQAVCAALMFEESIGLAAYDLLGEAMMNNTTLIDSVTLFPGAGNGVKLSPLAAHLLATAYGELPRRGIGSPHEGGHTTYDMRAP